MKISAPLAFALAALVVAAVVVARPMTANGESIKFSRTIDSLAPTFNIFYTISPGCSTKDQYGSNDCEIPFGSSIDVFYNASSSVAIAGGEIEVDLKIKDIITIPFSFKCAICGADCTFTIPVIKKQIDIPLPACPLPADGGVGNTTIAIPSESLPKASVTGTITATDNTGATLFKVELDAKIE